MIIPKTYVNSSDPIGSVLMVKIDKLPHMSIYVHHIPMTIHCLSHDSHDIPWYFHDYSHIVRYISIDQSLKKKNIIVCVCKKNVCVCVFFESCSHDTFPPVTPTGHLLPGEAVQQAILPTAQEHGHEDLPGNRPREGLGFGTCTWYVSWYNVIWW